MQSWWCGGECVGVVLWMYAGDVCGVCGVVAILVFVVEQKTAWEGLRGVGGGGMWIRDRSAYLDRGR